MNLKHLKFMINNIKKNFKKNKNYMHIYCWNNYMKIKN